jgi:hypothetical protein
MIKRIKKLTKTAEATTTMWTTVHFATDHKHTRKQRKAKIFTVSRSRADIPKINIFGILAKMIFNVYCPVTASVQIM